VNVEYVVTQLLLQSRLLLWLSRTSGHMYFGTYPKIPSVAKECQAAMDVGREVLATLALPVPSTALEVIRHTSTDSALTILVRHRAKLLRLV